MSTSTNTVLTYQQSRHRQSCPVEVEPVIKVDPVVEVEPVEVSESEKTKTLKKWSKHKKPFISAPGLARAILSVFLNHLAYVLTRRLHIVCYISR